MLLKIGLIFFMQMSFDFRVTWTFLGLLAILSTSEAEKNAQCAKQQAPVSESEHSSSDPWMWPIPEKNQQMIENKSENTLIVHLQMLKLDGL